MLCHPLSVCSLLSQIRWSPSFHPEFRLLSSTFSLLFHMTRYIVRCGWSGWLTDDMWNGRSDDFTYTFIWILFCFSTSVLSAQFLSISGSYLLLFSVKMMITFLFCFCFSNYRKAILWRLMERICQTACSPFFLTSHLHTRISFVFTSFMWKKSEKTVLSQVFSIYFRHSLAVCCAHMHRCVLGDF